MLSDGTVLCYLDDVLVFSETFEEHLERLEMVLQRLQSIGLKLKSSKCNFLQSEVLYLGHRVSSDGISTDPDKIVAVQRWLVPNTVKQLRSFLGSASYYRKYVQGFSNIAGPLHDLVTSLNKETKDHRNMKGAFQQCWYETCEEAFNSLKVALTTAPILWVCKLHTTVCCGDRCQSSWSRSCPVTGSEWKTCSDWFCQPSITSPGKAVQCHEA